MYRIKEFRFEHLPVYTNIYCLMVEQKCVNLVYVLYLLDQTPLVISCRTSGTAE